MLRDSTDGSETFEEGVAGHPSHGVRFLASGSKLRHERGRAVAHDDGSFLEFLDRQGRPRATVEVGARRRAGEVDATPPQAQGPRLALLDPSGKPVVETRVPEREDGVVRFAVRRGSQELGAVLSSASARLQLQGPGGRTGPSSVVLHVGDNGARVSIAEGPKQRVSMESDSKGGGRVNVHDQGGRRAAVVRVSGGNSTIIECFGAAGSTALTLELDPERARVLVRGSDGEPLAELPGPSVEDLEAVGAVAAE